MNRPARSIEIFTMSALDLFITAMGSFAILMMILFPYYKADRKELQRKKAERQGNVLFCVWHTRLQDYEQFINETAPPDPNKPRTVFDEPWKNPGYETQPAFPVTNVNYEEAERFCAWLTKKEREAGLIGPEDRYRLPTDAEWTLAAGPSTYPWGDAWPPPPRTGNFGGEEFAEGRGFTVADRFKGVVDDHELVAPVGSYPPHRSGLYDLPGNVEEICADWYVKEMNVPLPGEPPPDDDGGGRKFRVARGVSFENRYSPSYRADYRTPTPPDARRANTGFRCVLEINSPPKS